MTSSNDRTAGLSRRSLMVMGAGASAAALAACGGGRSAEDAAGGGAPQAGQTFSGKYEGPPVTLSYWNGFTGGDGPFMKQLVKDFQTANPNIKIAENTVQWGEYYQRMPAAVTAGKGPDVGAMHLDQLATNAARKIIVPVDDVATSLGLEESDFTKEVWNAGMYKDARYGIPLDVHSLAMYYNSEQAEAAGITEAPKDRAAFEDAIKKLQAKGEKNPFWMPSRWPAHLMFLTLIWQNGGEPYAQDGSRASFASQEGVEALQWMVDQVKSGASPANVAQDSQYVAFKNQKNPITWDGIWQINDLKGANVPFELAPVPQIFDQPLVWANSHNFYITRQSSQDANKLQAAKVFIDWMSKQSGKWAGAGMIPARTSVREGQEVTSSTQAPIASQIENLRFLPPVPGLGDVQAQTLEVAVAEAMLGKKDPATALKEAEGKATKLMEDNRQKFGA